VIISDDGGITMGFRDMDLDDQVRAVLRRDHTLPIHNIDISVRNGIVYLRGRVSSHQRDHTVNLIRGVDSVAAVVDQMNVS
jgi:osmotically-inducible protein OsmY